MKKLILLCFLLIFLWQYCFASDCVFKSNPFDIAENLLNNIETENNNMQKQLSLLQIELTNTTLELKQQKQSLEQLEILYNDSLQQCSNLEKSYQKLEKTTKRWKIACMAISVCLVTSVVIAMR